MSLILQIITFIVFLLSRRFKVNKPCLEEGYVDNNDQLAIKIKQQGENRRVWNHTSHTLFQVFKSKHIILSLLI